MVNSLGAPSVEFDFDSIHRDSDIQHHHLEWPYEIKNGRLHFNFAEPYRISPKSGAATFRFRMLVALGAAADTYTSDLSIIVDGPPPKRPTQQVEVEVLDPPLPPVPPIPRCGDVAVIANFVQPALITSGSRRQLRYSAVLSNDCGRAVPVHELSDDLPLPFTFVDIDPDSEIQKSDLHLSPNVGDQGVLTFVPRPGLFIESGDTLLFKYIAEAPANTPPDKYENGFFADIHNNIRIPDEPAVVSVVVDIDFLTRLTDLFQSIFVSGPIIWVLCAWISVIIAGAVFLYRWGVVHVFGATVLALILYGLCRFFLRVLGKPPGIQINERIQQSLLELYAQWGANGVVITALAVFIVFALLVLLFWGLRVLRERLT